MPIPDAPDFQMTVVTTDMAEADAPDFQHTVVGPGGTPIGGAGYASLTGAGETVTPGDLVQAGGFKVNDSAGDNIDLNSAGSISIAASGGGMNIFNGGGIGTDIHDSGGSGIDIRDTSGGCSIQLATTTINLNSPGGFIRLQSGLNVYPDNASAISGGLVTGDLYRTGADPDFVAIDH